MTSVSPMVKSALSDKPEDWHQIDWYRVERNVRGIQIRIAKATKEKDWRKVKSLQRFLTRSFCARVWAIRRVTTNRGKRTSGIDGVLWSTPDSKWKAVDELKQRGYHPLPLRRVRIPKANGKERLLGIPTMKDRAMQALYLLGLQPVAETQGDMDSYGFRMERSTADAIMQCYMLLRKQGSAQWVLEADIEGCFDHIDHNWLMNNVPMNKDVLRKWLKAGVVDMGRLHKTDEGTPQGGIISPTLANIALDGLQAMLAEHFGDKGSKPYRRNKCGMVRYADDFVITGTSKELLENEVRPKVEAFLAERGLKLSEAKTKVIHIDQGFDFLGWNVRKYKGKLLIKPSKKNITDFLKKVRDTIKANKGAEQRHLIWQLNPIIRGWVNYHKHQVSSDAFAYVDAHIYKALWQWARRRHNKKGNRWIARRYWRLVGTRHWTFCEPNSSSQEQEYGAAKLIYATDTKIKRHVKVKAEFNPFDPEQELYYEELKRARTLDQIGHKKKAISLYVQQLGRCGLCQTMMDIDSDFDMHHIVFRRYGGKDTLDNLILLHPNCHRQVHSQKLVVSKSASQA